MSHCRCILCQSSGWVAGAVRRYESGIYPGTPPYEWRKSKIRFQSMRWSERAREDRERLARVQGR